MNAENVGQYRRHRKILLVSRFFNSDSRNSNPRRQSMRRWEPELSFLADIRVEERHYVREHKVLFLNRKCMVRQERI
jgi:hypothetical protein